MVRDLFVVMSCYDGYDVDEVSYHLTRKGALRSIMKRKYKTWEHLRYIHDDDTYSLPNMWIAERNLYE